MKEGKEKEEGKSLGNYRKKCKSFSEAYEMLKLRKFQ